MRKFLLLSLLLSLPLMAVVPISEEKTYQQLIINPTDVKMGGGEGTAIVFSLGAAATVITAPVITPVVAVGVGLASIASLFLLSRTPKSSIDSASPGNTRWVNPNTVPSTTTSTSIPLGFTADAPLDKNGNIINIADNREQQLRDQGRLIDVKIEVPKEGSFREAKLASYEEAKVRKADSIKIGKEAVTAAMHTYEVNQAVPKSLVNNSTKSKTYQEMDRETLRAKEKTAIANCHPTSTPTQTGRSRIAKSSASTIRASFNSTSSFNSPSPFNSPNGGGNKRPTNDKHKHPFDFHREREHKE